MSSNITDSSKPQKLVFHVAKMKLCTIPGKRHTFPDPIKYLISKPLTFSALISEDEWQQN